MRRLLRPTSSPRRFAGETALLVLLNLLLAFLLWRELWPASMTPAPPPLAPPALPSATPTLPPTEPPPSPLPSATAPLSTATPSPTATLTPAPATATSTEAAPLPTQSITGIVRATGGLNLRDGPDGETTAKLADGTTVTLLAGRQETGGRIWQEVRTLDGLEGWVAADFLEVNP